MNQKGEFFPDVADINFTNPPDQQVNRASYREVRKYMVDYFSKSKDILSLYEFGTVNAPSISDIDLMIVLKDKPSPGVHKFLARDSVSNLARYLMMDNTLMVVNEEGFKNIPIWDDMNLVNLFGKDIKKNQPSEKESHFVEIARVMDWLPERTMRMVELVSRNEIPTRATLCLVNSFIYVIERLRDSFGFKFDSFESFVADFHTLRSDWFKIKDNEKVLYEYLKNSILMGFEAIHRFDDYCIINGFYGSDVFPETATFRLNPKITSWTKQKMYYNFSKDYNEISALESYNRCVSSKRSSIIVLPMSYYQHLYCYGSRSGEISSKIVQSLNPQNYQILDGINKDLKDLLYKRISIIDNMGIFLKENNVKRGLLKFGWFL